MISIAIHESGGYPADKLGLWTLTLTMSHVTKYAHTPKQIAKLKTKAAQQANREIKILIKMESEI